MGYDTVYLYIRRTKQNGTAMYDHKYVSRWQLMKSVDQKSADQEPSAI